MDFYKLLDNLMENDEIKIDKALEKYDYKTIDKKYDYSFIHLFISFVRKVRLLELKNY